MPLRRGTQAPRRVIEQFIPIPEGLDELVYDGEEDEDDEWFDVDEDDSDRKPTKKKKKKKKKKKNTNKKGKKKNKNKRKKRRRKRGKDEDRGKKDINTPRTLTIVKQKLRTKADGSQVVDIVVEVDKINRADKYEFRTTKKDTGKTTVIEG
jgi:hypothetical protein